MTVVPARHGLGVCFGCGCDRDQATQGCRRCQSRHYRRRRKLLPPPVATPVVNVRVRTAKGVGGTVVVMAAWCEECGKETMPVRDGLCSWCQTRIVDEGLLKVTARGVEAA